MKLLSFCICDDIRTEIGKKFSIIGTYSDKIIFNVPKEQKGKWPKHLKLGFFARILLEDAAPKYFNFKMKGAEHQLVLVKGELENISPDNPIITLSLIHPQVVFPSAGRYEFTYEFLDINNNPIGAISPYIDLAVQERATE